MARTDRRAAALLALALLLSGCSGRQAAGESAPDLTELKRFAREQLAASLQQQGVGQYEILGASWVSRSDPSGRFAAGFDVDITDAAGHTRYESYGVVVGLDANGDLVVLDIGPQTESDSPLY